MKWSFLVLFLGLLHVSLTAQLSNNWGRFSILEIDSLTSDKVISIKDNKETKISDKDFSFRNLYGCPYIDDGYDMAGFAYHKNRFIGKYKGQYCLIDTNFNVIIAPCDTIIGNTFGPWHHKSGDILYGVGENQFGRNVCYQAVRSELTWLYDNFGKLIINGPFQGFLMEDDLKCDTCNYYLTRNADFSVFGLIDQNGNLLMQDSEEITRVIWCCNETWRWSPYFIFRNQDKVGLFNAELNQWVAEYAITTDFNPPDNLLYLLSPNIHLIKENNQYGIFHTEYGIVLETKYDTIISPHFPTAENFDSSQKLIVKKGRLKRSWKVPQEYLNCECIKAN